MDMARDLPASSVSPHPFSRVSWMRHGMTRVPVTRRHSRWARTGAVSVSIAQLQKGAHHSRITQLFKDQAGKALQKRGIQPDWRSPAETPDGRRPFTVAVFTPEDKRMDSDDVAIALHKSGIGAAVSTPMATFFVAQMVPTVGYPMCVSMCGRLPMWVRQWRLCGVLQRSSVVEG